MAAVADIAPGASSSSLNIGQVQESIEVNPAHPGRALQNSGAADLLRPFRNAWHGANRPVPAKGCASTDTPETRTSGSGYTAEITAARESYINRVTEPGAGHQPQDRVKMAQAGHSGGSEDRAQGASFNGAE